MQNHDDATRLFLAREHRVSLRPAAATAAGAQSYPTTTDHGDHPVCRRQRQRRRHAASCSTECAKIDRAALHRREPPRRRRQHRHCRSGQGDAGRLHPGRQRLRTRSRSTSRSIKTSATTRRRTSSRSRSFAVFHHRRRGQHEAAGQDAERAGRLRQGATQRSSTTARSASAARSIWPASISSRSPASKLTHVPYRNIAQYGPDLIAGTVPLGFQWLPNVAGRSAAEALRRSRSRATSGMRGAARRADHRRGRRAGTTRRPAGSRCAGAARHAEADRRAAQQGIDGRAERSGGAAEVHRAGRRRPVVTCRRRSSQEFMPSKSSNGATSSPRPASPQIE